MMGNEALDRTQEADQALRLSDPHRFFDVEYRIPQELIGGKASVTVRFEAKAGSQIATVFALRMVRGDTAR